MIVTPLTKDYKRRSKSRKRVLDIGGRVKRERKQERKIDRVYKLGYSRELRGRTNTCLGSLLVGLSLTPHTNKLRSHYCNGDDFGHAHWW